MLGQLEIRMGDQLNGLVAPDYSPPRPRGQTMVLRSAVMLSVSHLLLEERFTRGCPGNLLGGSTSPGGMFPATAEELE